MVKRSIAFVYCYTFFKILQEYYLVDVQPPVVNTTLKNNPILLFPLFHKYIFMKPSIYSIWYFGRNGYVITCMYLDGKGCLKNGLQIPY